MRTYWVRVSSAAMPGKVKAPYKHVAVMKSLVGPVAEGPVQIRETAKWKVIAYWPKLHLGWFPKGGTAAEIAIEQAKAMAENLEDGGAK